MEFLWRLSNQNYTHSKWENESHIFKITHANAIATLKAFHLHSATVLCNWV